MIDARARSEFWKVVEDCMVKLFNIPIHISRERCGELARSIDSPPEVLEGELFFHSEPYDVACDLAGEKPIFDLHSVKYQRIVNQHQW